MYDRIPPQSLQAEAALLGAMMVDRELVPVVLAHTRPEDFYAHVNGIIFGAIIALHDHSEPTDKIAVATELGAKKLLEKCGGVSYLSSLLDSVQTASSAEYYAKVVSEKATLRRLISASAKIAEIAYGGEVDVTSAVVEAERELRDAVAGATQGDFGCSMGEAVLDAYRTLEGAATGKSVPGLSSPWPQLDMATGRTFPGELIVWAAAPQSGKSIAVSQVALHVASEHGSVAVFALEMGIAGTVRRMLAKFSGLSSRRLRTGDMRPYDWDHIGRAVDSLTRLPIRLFDRSKPKTVSDVRRCLSRMSLEAPVKAVFIDHANFLDEATNASARASKTERLDDVYKGLLQIASEFGCVMHVVQHLNRAGMDGKPSLMHLRDGGNLEGHAHVVIFPYRPDIAGDPTRGEFIIGKNREFELRSIPMYFDGQAQEWREAQTLEGAA